MKLRRFLLVLLFALPLAVVVGLGVWRSGEDLLLRRASAAFQSGQWEASLNQLGTLRKRPLLSGGARRKAAELFFRMGEDVQGHALLKGQGFHENDPEDRELRELTSRCLRAARLLETADKARDPAERLRYAQQAQVELPDAPRVLQRVVLEELGALTRAKTRQQADALTEAYLEDYAVLRHRAPTLAAAVRRQHEALLGQVEN